MGISLLLHMKMLIKKEEFVECEMFVWLLNAEIIFRVWCLSSVHIIVLFSTLKSVLKILWFFDLLEIKWQISLLLQRLHSLNAEIKCYTLWILCCWTAFFSESFRSFYFDFSFFFKKMFEFCSTLPDCSVTTRRKF